MNNSQWGERTAAATLLVGVIVTMAGLGVTISLQAYVAGAILIVAGVCVGLAAYATYRF